MEFLNPSPPASKKGKLELPNDIKSDVNFFHGKKNIENVHEEEQKL